MPEQKTYPHDAEELRYIADVMDVLNKQLTTGVGIVLEDCPISIYWFDKKIGEIVQQGDSFLYVPFVKSEGGD